MQPVDLADEKTAYIPLCVCCPVDLTDPVRCNSIEEIRALRDAHEEFKRNLTGAETDFKALRELDKQIKQMATGTNPYTWFTMEALEETWASLRKIIGERDGELEREAQRQERNDALRRQFAQLANAFHGWLQITRNAMMEGGGSLEEQLEAIRVRSGEVREKKSELKQIEDLGSVLEENLVLDNRYTEHSTVSLAQQWDQLDQLGMFHTF